VRERLGIDLGGSVGSRTRVYLVWGAGRGGISCTDDTSNLTTTRGVHEVTVSSFMPGWYRVLIVMICRDELKV
jgi:hypothetical protein